MAAQRAEEDALAGWSARELATLRRRLRAWYREAARPLPWRESHDAYRVWISEIMLQQTTVAAVIPYYERFLTRFPTVAALAAATESDVLQLWEGLGYYSRARNLRRAAQVVVEQHAGEFPQAVEELQALPGIGRYTAGAIVSFAFNRPAPIVEANTLRLYCRLLGTRVDPRSAVGQRLLWEFAGRLPPASEPSEINQALMELGATVCTPRTPGCARCPLLSHCRAAATGLQHEIPPPARRPELTRVVERAVVVRRRGQVLLMQHGVDERWAGLWNFLRFPAEEVTGSLSEHLQQRFGVRATVGDPFHTLTHGVTRYHITLHCHAAQWQSGEPQEGTRPFQWVTLEKLAGVPLPQSGRKLARLLVAEGTTTQRRLFAE